MFCPKCHAEYREGFTECADCQVPLIASSPEARAAERDFATGPLVPLWEGENLALHTSLLEALDAAGIRYFSKPLGIYPGARRWDPYPIQPMTRFGYQVAVLSSNLAEAEKILENLLDEDPQDMELPERNEPAGATLQAPASADEEPISQIWSGPDGEFARFLQDALRENEIVFRSESVGGENRIFVRPSDASSAKEILRELTDGAPPQ